MSANLINQPFFILKFFFNIQYPDLFAASLFVSCQWDVEKMKEFKEKKFIYLTAGGDHTANGGTDQLKALLRKENAPFETASWSARLLETEPDSSVVNLLSKKCNRYFITFEGDTDLPEGITNPDPGMVHMESFNYAYKLKPVTEWLIQQHK